MVFACRQTPQAGGLAVSLAASDTAAVATPAVVSGFSRTGYPEVMQRMIINDGPDAFDVTVLRPESPAGVVLFGVGAGGNPERHLPLLEALAANGFTVVAPHFQRIVPASATAADLLLRGRRLKLALEGVAPGAQRVVGVGHSIGATMLLALAGAQMWMPSRNRLGVDRIPSLSRIVMMTPPTRFFEAPGALDLVRVPILVFAGSKDDVTPPAEQEFLRTAIGRRAPVEVRVEEGAGHFSFMNVLPPNVDEPLADRDPFLARLASEICAFASA